MADCMWFPDTKDKIEYTEKESKILKLMFSLLDTILQAGNGYFDIDYESFSRGDLFNLAEKIGVEEY